MSTILIYDCDGVLRNEDLSYQRCKAETVGIFDGGRNATKEEISKSKIGIPDDWLGTLWILEQRGIKVNFKKVKKHFQDLYLGKDRKFSGYINDEVWLANNELLKKLADKYPLCMVSGAPKEEIEYTTRKNKALEYFRLIIGMHDCENKHEGIKKALEHFNASEAYFCDDRPSGLKQGKPPTEGKRVHLYGILPPNPEDDLDKLLMELGAIDVFPNVDEYNDFLISKLCYF
jgi:phosphoglycolate phosphatase-like HAD superfamily hydrolase